MLTKDNQQAIDYILNVDELVNDLVARIAKEIRSEKDSIPWLIEARDNMNNQIIGMMVQNSGQN